MGKSFYLIMMPNKKSEDCQCKWNLSWAFDLDLDKYIDARSSSFFGEYECKCYLNLLCYQNAVLITWLPYLFHFHWCLLGFRNQEGIHASPHAAPASFTTDCVVPLNTFICL